MTIHYALFANKMTDSPEDYLTMVRAVGTAAFDTITARVVEIGTAVTKSDILAVFEEMSRTDTSLLLDGFSTTVAQETVLYG